MEAWGREKLLRQLLQLEGQVVACPKFLERTSKMRVMLTTFSFLLAVVSSTTSTASVVDRPDPRETNLTVKKAEKIAINEFRRRSKGRVARVSARLLESNDREWVFVVENAGEEPAPGSELYVTVYKRTAKVESYFGK